jgi:3'(2'), 5'-bisphosphate nucleotidase
VLNKQDLSKNIVQIAHDAGKVIMEVYGKEEIKSYDKDDKSPVTEADIAGNTLILKALRSAYPQIPVVTEEAANTHGEVAADRFFIVDPLDGTKSFIKKTDDFTVNIALIENGVPVEGVVYAPAMNKTWYTDGNGKAWLDGQELRVNKPDNDALVVVASKSHRDAATDDYIARYKVKDFEGIGSSLKFCLVAEGKADLYPRLGRTMEWDTAAGDAVLRTAGGKVVHYETWEPLQYGKQGFENPFFIAYAEGVTLKRRENTQI